MFLTAYFSGRGTRSNFWQRVMTGSWDIFILSLFLPRTLQVDEHGSFWSGVFAPFSTGFWEWSLFPLALALLCSGIFLLCAPSAAEGGNRSLPSAIALPLFLYSLWVLANIWHYGVTPSSIWLLGHWILGGFIIFTLSWTQIPLRPLLAVFCLAAAGAALYGIGQVLMSLKLGTDLPSGLPILQGEWGEVLRASGPFTHPNILGLVLGCAFFWSEVCLTNWRQIRPLLLVGIIFTFSRTTLLGILLGLCLQSFASRIDNKGRGKTISRLSIFSFLGIFSAFFFRQIFDSISPSNGDRWRQIFAALKIIRDFPIWGVGLGNFPHVMPHYADVFPWSIEPVHNLFLLLGSELGIIAALGAVLIFWRTGKVLWKLARRPSQNALLGSFGLLLGFALLEHALVTSWVAGVCGALWGTLLWREVRSAPQNSR